jgi:hypothetical protein
MQQIFLISVFLAREGNGCVIAAALICKENYDGLMAAGSLGEESTIAGLLSRHRQDRRTFADLV